MSVRLLFVHGWAFTPAFWAPLLKELPDLDAHCLDLGFFGPPRLDMPNGDDDIVAVGHSLGLLWLLRTAQAARLPVGDSLPGSLQRPFRAMVSLGGFSVFSAMPDLPCGVSSTAIKVMRRGLGRGQESMEAVLKTFHRNCATPEELRPDTGLARSQRLTEGLDWLLTWDQRADLEGLDIPITALAAKDDAIVPPALTRACFSGKASRLEWLSTGGHAFPLTRPQACAHHIRAFLAELA